MMSLMGIRRSSTSFARWWVKISFAVCSMAGKGSFVAPDQRVDQNRIELLLRQFDEAAAELKFMGYSPEELGRRIQKGGNQV